MAWSRGSETIYLFCTPRLPAYISRNEDGSWEAVRLNLAAVPGASETAVAVYLAVCHLDQPTTAEAAVARHGYTSWEGEATIRLSQPEAIFQHLN